MKDTPYSDLLAGLKAQAMALANARQGTYLRLLEGLVRQHNLVDLHQLQQLAKAEVLSETRVDAEVLSCEGRMQPLYRVRIGQSIWSLQISKSGPMLTLEDRPFCTFEDDSHKSDLGVFQVLVRAADMLTVDTGYPTEGWVLTRYGHYRAHTLEFFTEDDARALSHHFGVPLAEDGFSPHTQSQYSEICFLKSPAFASLRKAFRSGQAPLPPMKSWTYGLCSIWPHLVAMSDNDFKSVEKVATWYLRTAGVKLPHDQLLERWCEVPELGISGKGIGTLGEMFRLLSTNRKAKRAKRLMAPR